MLKSFKRKLKQFTANVDGNITIMFALTAVPILLASGAAIDYARYTMVRQQVAAALDNATLAAVSSLYGDENVTQAEINAAKNLALAHYRANIGEGLGLEDPVFTYESATLGFKASVSGEVPNNFMQLAGINSLALNVQTEALGGIEKKIGSDLEVTMMLDTTGSMCNNEQGPCASGRKIDALKQAANLFIDEVVWQDQSKNTAKVALVPFANRVRFAKDGVASAAFTAATNLAPVWSGWVRTTEQVQTGTQCTEWNGYWTGSGKNRKWVNTTCKTEVPVYSTVYTGKWMPNFGKVRPCVTERYYNATARFDLTDDAPGPGKWLNGNDGTRRLESLDSTDTPITDNGKTKPKYISPSNNSNPNAISSYPTLAGNYSSSGACSTIHNNNSVMPLTNDVNKLKAHINGLNAAGGTSGALGTAVAWYAISPNWASVWGADHVPQPYSKMNEFHENGKQKLYKIAVLMTDGEYNSARAGSANVGTVNAAALALCANMKAKGIEIYTVGFETTPVAENLLKQCATSNEHFYSASGAQALQDAFKEIGQRVRTTAGGEVRLAR